jgi:hypothetical protein
MRTGSKDNRLMTIADDMRDTLETQGDEAALHRPLPHGLQIVMQRRDRHHWRLALGREGIYPSDTEIETCRRAFHVPEAAEIARRTAQYRHPKSGRTITYYVAELTWVEKDKMRQPAPAGH